MKTVKEQARGDAKVTHQRQKLNNIKTPKQKQHS